MESWQRASRLRKEGREVVVLIGCGAKKRSGRHKAGDLYVGEYFKLCRSLALLLVPTENVFVMSAKYGILSLDREVESYDLKVTNLSSNAYNRWKQKIRKFVLDKKQDGFTPVFICGKSYYDDLPGIKVLPVMGIGKQMQWMRGILSQGKGFGLCTE